ncbi:MAG: tetratricopeptide (TPR) repeat protein [Myxococcota bacterium]
MTPAPPEHIRPSGADARHVASVFAVALALRLAYLPIRLAWPDADAPAVDAAFHDYWAWGLVSGEWGAPGGQIVGPAPGIEARPSFRPPGYPWFLAGIYAVFGRSASAVLGVQAALGALAAALVVPLGDRLGGRPVGLLAGLLAALTWTTIYFGGELQPPVLVAPLVLGALLLAPALPQWQRAAAGGLLGAAGIAVPNLLALLPVIALCGRGRLAHRAVAPILAACLVLTLPLARNVRVAGEWVPLTTNLGVNLFAGNNPTANGWDVAVSGFGTSFDHPALVRQASLEAGRSLTDVEASGFYVTKATAWMRENPAEVGRLTARRAGLWWHRTEILSNKELNGARAEAWVLAAPIGAATLTLLAVPALARRRWHTPTVVAIMASILLLMSSYLPFFVNARYRQPALPLLACLAAAGLVRLWEARRDLRTLAACALGMLAVAALLWAPGFAPSPQLGRWDLALGVTHARMGDDPAGITRFDAGIARSPELAQLHFERGRAHLRLGRSGSAAADFDAAWALDPSEVVAMDRIRAHRAANPARAAAAGVEAMEAHPNSPTLAWNTHLAQRDLGDLASATTTLRRLTELQPDNVAAQEALAQVLHASGADASDAWLTLARLHARAQRSTAARQALAHVLDDPRAAQIEATLPPR